jgi:hypothetical protein
MNIKEVKELISDILRSDVCEFELEHTGTKVRLKRGFLSQERLPISSPTWNILAPSWSQASI